MSRAKSQSAHTGSTYPTEAGCREEATGWFHTGLPRHLVMEAAQACCCWIASARQPPLACPHVPLAVLFILCVRLLVLV